MNYIDNWFHNKNKHIMILIKALKKENVMKDSNILLIVILMMIGVNNSIWAVDRIAIISNISNKTIGVQFNTNKVSGFLNPNNGTINIPKDAKFVTVTDINSKKLISSFPINSLTSYYIIGTDLLTGDKNILPWSIMDLKTYEKSDMKKLQDELQKELINVRINKNGSSLKNYLDKLKDSAQKKDINTFKLMFSILYSSLTPYLPTITSMLPLDPNQIMQNIANIQPLNFDTFQAYIKAQSSKFGQ